MPHVHTSYEPEVFTLGTGWVGSGDSWPRHGSSGVSRSEVKRIPIGTLIVDLVDAKTDNLVWRGTTTVLHQQETPDQKERHLDEAVAKMFEGFPPRGRTS